MSESLEARLQRAYAQMNLHEGFRGAVFAPLPYTVGDDGTAWVDGTRAYYGRDFCDTLTDDELLFVVLHEATHVIFTHMWRRGERDPALWNIATDAVINAGLIRDGYTMPKGGVFYDWVRPDMSSEDVYARLKQDPPPQQPQPDDGQGEGQGDGTDGQGNDGDSDGDKGHTGGGGWDGQGDCPDAPSNSEVTDAEVTASIMAKARSFKAAGLGGALVERVLREVKPPKVPWYTELLDYMLASKREGFSYRRFSKRALGRGMYLPGRYSENMGGMVIGFDTSGSITQDDADRIASEINAIVEVVEPAWVEVVHCDTDVRHVERFDRGEAVTLTPHGGGGTKLAPVLRHAATVQDAEVLVYFTDLMSTDTPRLTDPGLPVVWAALGNYRPTIPFGRVIDVVV